MNTSNPYEQTIRVFTVFLSVVMGFGLKRILEGAFTWETATLKYQWPAFLAALFVFLRFLFGSANHLQVEYGSLSENTAFRTKHWWLLAWDFMWLSVYGVAALAICYSDTIDSFLDANMRLGGIAATGAGLDWVVRYYAKVSTPPEHSVPWMLIWFAINLMYINAALATSELLLPFETTAKSGMSPALLAFASATFVLLAADLLFQFYVLGRKDDAAGTAPV